MLYNQRSGRDVSRSNDDIKLLPSVVERVLIPKITGFPPACVIISPIVMPPPAIFLVFVETVWDPLSTRETRNLVSHIVKLVASYPTLSSDSKNSKVSVVI